MILNGWLKEIGKTNKKYFDEINRISEIFFFFCYLEHHITFCEKHEKIKIFDENGAFPNASFS